jgi:prophage antirepressor-like protein
LIKKYRLIRGRGKKFLSFVVSDRIRKYLGKVPSNQKGIRDVLTPSGLQKMTTVFEGHRVRFVGTEEAPEWVAADVVATLYPEADKRNRSNYLAKVPTEWVGHKQIMTNVGERKVTTILEPGLYHLTARSNSPVAIRFQKWLYEDVVPTIRKHGSYTVPNQPPQPPAHTLQDALSLADYVAATMSDCGVDPVFVACDRLDSSFSHNLV